VRRLSLPFGAEGRAVQAPSQATRCRELIGSVTFGAEDIAGLPVELTGQITSNAQWFHLSQGSPTMRDAGVMGQNIRKVFA
jgi:hypothetical protein